MAADRLTRPVIGVRVPGLGRLRFCEVATPEATLHAWVAVPGPLGDEAGQIVVSPQQVVLDQLPNALPRVTRALSADEVAQVATLTQQARERLDAAIATVRAADLPVFVTGLRLTLAGDGAVVTWRGPGVQLADILEHALAGAIDLPLHLDWEGPLDQIDGGLFGGVGRLRAAPFDLDSALRERFDLPGGPEVFAPETLPRLGARVQTPDGPGTLQAVSMRHKEATVRLESGEDVSVPLDALSEP